MSIALKHLFPRLLVIGSPVWKEPLKRSMSSNSTDVLLEKIQRKGVITLNRPKALNALDLSMIRKIYPQLKTWQNETDLVIIKGAGDKAFCAGGDVRAVTESGKKAGSLTKEFFKEEYWLNNLIGSLKIPYIALLNGITMGGGVGLSVHGRFRVGTEKTLFAMPETAIGLFPDVGGGYFLPRLSNNIGIYLALTGYRLKGRDALYAGITTHTCDSQKLPQLEEELLKLDNASDSSVKQLLDKYSQDSLFDKGKEFSLQPYLSKIDSIFGAETVEEIYKRLEKDGSEWAIKELNNLKKMSPSSMKISLRQLRTGAKLSLSDCLRMEYRMSQGCCANHDFYEGVRAVLIDRDNEPKWKPSSLSEVTDDIVDGYFAPLPPEDELVL